MEFDLELVDIALYFNWAVLYNNKNRKKSRNIIVWWRCLSPHFWTVTCLIAPCFMSSTSCVRWRVKYYITKTHHRSSYCCPDCCCKWTGLQQWVLILHFTFFLIFISIMSCPVVFFLGPFFMNTFFFPQYVWIICTELTAFNMLNFEVALINTVFLISFAL